jgi:hypothetical protein
LPAEQKRFLRVARNKLRNLIGFPWDRHASLAMTIKSMVELTGVEPATSGVQNRRSPN